MSTGSTPLYKWNCKRGLPSWLAAFAIEKAMGKPRAWRFWAPAEVQSRSQTSRFQPHLLRRCGSVPVKFPCRFWEGLASCLALT